MINDNNNAIPKRYGFWTATAMVVGIVIGSGIFFKADDVLAAAGGRLGIALLAWAIGGAIMITSASVFARIASRIEKVNGVVDYFEAAYGESAGYLVAWFLTTVYFPSLAAVLSWVSARYTMALFPGETGLWGLALFYLLLFFLINSLTPLLAGRFQVSATVIKMIPLLLVAVFGTAAGLVSGQVMENFRAAAGTLASSADGGGLALATLSTAFAYEGWIIATSINAEIKDSRRNLPRALLAGTMVVALIYLIYNMGIAGVLSNQGVLEAGDTAPVQVLSRIFGNVGGTLLTVFVIISCLGTLNGLAMGTSRGFYSMASRGRGPGAAFFSRINHRFRFPINSALGGFLLALVWLGVWYGNFAGFWSGFFDISELPIVLVYTIYILLYIWYMRHFTEQRWVNRFVMPLLAGAGSVFIIIAGLRKAYIGAFLLVTASLLGLAVWGDPSLRQRLARRFRRTGE